jgi:hypothetical protein
MTEDLEGAGLQRPSAEPTRLALFFRNCLLIGRCIRRNDSGQLMLFRKGQDIIDLFVI